MSNPKISIITISLNNADGLLKTISSVLEQTYQPLEYIVIDGDSQDDSKAIIQKNASRIDFAISEKDSGIYAAMNKGIEKATGDYLLFLNSGDVLLVGNPLQQMIDNGSSADLIYGNIRMSGNGISRIGVFPEKLSFKFFYINSLPHPCTLINKRLFDKIGVYREDFKVASDWAFFVLAVCKFNCSYKHVNVLVADFSLGGISSSHETTIKNERKIIIQTYFNAFENDYKEMYLLEIELSNLKKQIGYRIYNKIIKIISGNGR